MSTATIHVLGLDPSTQHRLNACSYQASAIISWNEFQYAAFYTSKHLDRVSPRQINLARRRIFSERSRGWETFAFDDYEQLTDDGHNTISLGICRGDGTIHLSFDHHSNQLKYRVSVKHLATSPESQEWSARQFGEIRNALPGPTDSPDLRRYVQEVSYPRFVSLDSDMLFEYRIGKAGSGSNVLWRYHSNDSTFTFLSTYLIGMGCNPYPNGMSYDEYRKTLHISWTNRHFIVYEGHDDPNSTAHMVQAGPNGPENNQDLCYALSTDHGDSWRPANEQRPGKNQSSVGENESSGVLSIDSGFVAMSIPKDSGIMNQESQCLDTYGGFHVLNRDNTSAGQELWKHYYLSAGTLQWIAMPLPLYRPTETGPRGSIAYSRALNSIIFALPSNPSADKEERQLHVLRERWREAKSSHAPIDRYVQVWSGTQFDGEPLMDEYALEHYDLLSIFTTRPSDDSDGRSERQVVVIDVDFEDL